jgi:hypothetical protein
MIVNDLSAARSSTLLPTLLLLLLPLMLLAKAHPQVEVGGGGNNGYVTLDKSEYDESESIVVAFVLPHPPISVDDDDDYANVGLFMRDADPQGGALSPIVSVLVRDADGCDPDEVKLCAGRRNVTFGNERRYAMVGTWPIEVKDHGVGYDAWVLDGMGRAAIGPAEFGIRRRDECDDGEGEGDRTGTTSGLLKFNKGIKRPA